MKKTVLFLALAIASLSAVFGQGREFIRQKIKTEGNCRNVAITRYNGDLMLYGKNGWAATGCPKSLTDALNEINDNDQYIDDVQLTEYGRWLILYGDNGFQWNDIPYGLEQKLRQYNNNDEVVLSVTFNDAGDWIIISKDHFSSSSDDINRWLKEGTEKFGQLWAACLTDEACVAVYARGYKYLGNIPATLDDALYETPLNVFRLKIAGSDWLFADKYGRFSYNM